MLGLFKIIFMINFFIFPISAGFLSYRKIRGRPAGRFFRMTVMSLIMLLLSWTGILLNESQENKLKTIENIHQSLDFDE